MEKLMESVALIEFGRGHSECLYSQVQFLKQGGYKVSIICNKTLKGQVMAFDGVDDFLFLDIKDTYWNDLLSVMKLNKFLSGNGISQVVVNTFAGKSLKFFLLTNRSIDIFGVVHSVSKLKKRYLSGGLSNQVKGFFLLNDYLLHHCPEIRKKITTFYPIYFPKFPPQALEKGQDELWVCIPGALEYKRRDYLKLLDLVTDDLDKRVRFILLGNGFHRYGDGPDFEARIDGDDRFVLFDRFVDNDLFHSYLACSDLVMPLSGTVGGYQTDCISGSINLAFSYKIPLLSESVYQHIDDFQVSSFFYDENLVERLNHLCAHRDAIREKTEQMRAFSKFDFKYQAEKYVSFIRSR